MEDSTSGPEFHLSFLMAVSEGGGGKENLKRTRGQRDVTGREYSGRWVRLSPETGVGCRLDITVKMLETGILEFSRSCRALFANMALYKCKPVLEVN